MTDTNECNRMNMSAAGSEGIGEYRSIAPLAVAEVNAMVMEIEDTIENKEKPIRVMVVGDVSNTALIRHLIEKHGEGMVIVENFSSDNMVNIDIPDAMFTNNFPAFDFNDFPEIASLAHYPREKVKNMPFYYHRRRY